MFIVKSSKLIIPDIAIGTYAVGGTWTRRPLARAARRIAGHARCDLILINYATSLALPVLCELNHSIRHSKLQITRRFLYELIKYESIRRKGKYEVSRAGPRGAGGLGAGAYNAIRTLKFRPVSQTWLLLLTKNIFSILIIKIADRSDHNLHFRKNV